MKLLIVILCAIFLSGCQTCVKSHKEIKYRNTWVQYVPCGKSLCPIVHPARYIEVDVCDLYQQKYLLPNKE